MDEFFSTSTSLNFSNIRNNLFSNFLYKVSYRFEINYPTLHNTYTTIHANTTHKKQVKQINIIKVQANKHQNESAEVGEHHNFQYHSAWLDSDQAFTEYMAQGFTGPSQVEQVNVNDSIILKNIY